jgi:membrane protein YqaA with SNARE-associated domain
MEQLNELIRDYGGPGLCVVSFIAATIFPLSSEAAVYGAVKAGMPWGAVFFWASLGNCLGVTLNYALGRWGSEKALPKVMDSRSGRRAMEWSERYGKWTLLLSWLPVVGDPLTIIAGLMRVNLVFFIVVSYAVRVARYAALLAAIEG